MPDDTLSIYARSQPDKPGVIDDKPDGTVVTWTYAELNAQSNRVANLLLSLGAGPVRAPGSSLTGEEITAFAREHLASYKVPRSIDFTDELPRTGSGKLLKRQLPGALLGRPDRPGRIGRVYSTGRTWPVKLHPSG